MAEKLCSMAEMRRFVDRSVKKTSFARAAKRYWALIGARRSLAIREGVASSRAAE
jgi:hypothetical protein